jgi:DNA polymerase-4
MPAAHAIRLCPEAVFVRPDFARYQEESRRIHAIFASVTDLVEPLSLDEAYLDVTANRLDEPLAQVVAAHLRERIRAETGLTASAGVAPIKFVAKVASDRCKPDGLCVVHPSRLRAFIAALPVEAMPGVGPRTAERCHAYGLRRIGDFLGVDEAQLRAWFGASAAWFRAAAQGIDERPVQAHGAASSIGAEQTFERDLRTAVEAADRLTPIAERVERRLRRAGLAARTVTLKVRYADFRRISRSRTLSQALDHPRAILGIARSLIPETAIGVTPVRLLGISLSHLEGGNGRQLVIDEVMEQCG